MFTERLVTYNLHLYHTKYKWTADVHQDIHINNDWSLLIYNFHKHANFILFKSIKTYIEITSTENYKTTHTLSRNIWTTGGNISLDSKLLYFEEKKQWSSVVGLL